MSQYRDMFGDAFKLRLAVLYTHFSRDPSDKEVKRRKQKDVDATMAADTAQLSLLNCAVKEGEWPQGDCFFVNNCPDDCEEDENQLASVVYDLAWWGLSRNPMHTEDFNGLEEKEKAHTELSGKFHLIWKLPFKIELTIDERNGQQCLELVNQNFPWKFQKLSHILFGDWSCVFRRLRLFCDSAPPKLGQDLRFGKSYRLKHILDNLVSRDGYRLFMTSLNIDKDETADVEPAEAREKKGEWVKERAVLARGVLEPSEKIMFEPSEKIRSHSLSA
jgi:hypothetical protein